MIEAYGKSDVGRIRKTNQDAYKAVLINEHALYAVVCDGMGGENGGNVASQAAVDIINKEILGNYNNTENKIDLLTYAVIKANECIYNLSQTTIELRGMGTTATVVMVENDGLYIAHVGDSRVYRLRGDSFDLLTADHSLVQLLVDKGEITPEQARVHPQ
ncbi:MAG: serine/threonine-protein phosphatase, partial [Oscillospiraceae bacterium]|nr:serine/threonine-protein phosphatase [Oscillospiraceae bacterium]